MFDLTNVEETQSALPAGEYSVFIDKAEFKTSKTGAEYLSMQLKVIGPTQKDRVVFENLNILHSDTTTKNIALASLKSMMISAGVESLSFATKEELLGKLLSPLRFDISTKIKSDSYGDKAVIKKYLPYSGNDTVNNPISTDDIPF